MNLCTDKRSGMLLPDSYIADLWICRANNVVKSAISNEV